MADLVLVLLALLAIGVGTLLWAIHEYRQMPPEDRDPPKPHGDA